MKSMEWIDVTSLKLLALSIWLTIYSMVIPESVIGIFALIASVSTIGFNLYRFYDNRKKKNNDRDH